MPRRSARSRGNANNNNNNEPAPRAVAAHVRERQRAVAEREAARLARPEARPANTLGHADRKKSAVSSTPFGLLQSSSRSPMPVAANISTWCGPFTVAREMIASREAAKRQREAELQQDQEGEGGVQHPLDAAMVALDEEKQKRLHPSLTWKSRIPSLEVEQLEDYDTNGKKKPKKRLTAAMRRRQQQEQLQLQRGKKFPSLYQLCVDFVVQNFEHVETLGDVDHSIRTNIAHELAGLNRLNAEAFQALFVEPGIEALEIIDCADIPQEALCHALSHQLHLSLRYMALDQAGRCFGPKTVQTLVGLDHHNHKQHEPVQLFALSVGGAYLLTDADAARLIQTMAPTLQSLAFKACPLLQIQFCHSIQTSFEHSTLLELALEDLTMDRTCLEALVMAGDENCHGKPVTKPWQRNLKSLTLKRISGLTDDIVVPLLQGAASTLEHLDLSGNSELTDVCLGPLRTNDAAGGDNTTSSPLRSLQLAELKQLTAIGLEALFTPALAGMGNPPQLRVLNLNHCHVGTVTDQVLELVLQAASRKRTAEEAVNNNNNLSLLGGLVRLELQGSPITDATLETVAATCATSLEHLDVSFCPHISNQGLGYLVDQVGHQLECINVWGCAQISDEFLNGHSRASLASDSANGSNPIIVPLQIAGAWVKKSGASSIR